MKRLIWILPAIALLTQIVEPAGPHQVAALHMPFYSLPSLLVLAFMAMAAMWPDKKIPSGASDQRASDGAVLT